jgi:large subunit ribosomal protein L21
MYAIIEAGSKQYKVTPGEIIDVELLKETATVNFDKVLLISDDGKFEVGTPFIKGAAVSAKVLGNGKDPKVTIFKYKNKTNYHRKIGHRQPYTRVQIEEVKHGA